MPTVPGTWRTGCLQCREWIGQMLAVATGGRRTCRTESDRSGLGVGMAALDHEQVDEPGRVGRVVAEQRGDLQHRHDLPAVQRSDCWRDPDVERRAGEAPSQRACAVARRMSLAASLSTLVCGWRRSNEACCWSREPPAILNETHGIPSGYGSLSSERRTRVGMAVRWAHLVSLPIGSGRGADGGGS
jgi:hypothetical protein